MELLQEVKVLLSHEIPDGNYNQILNRMAQLSVDLLKKGRSEPRNKSENENETAIPTVDRSELQCEKSRYIAKETKRRIFHRAEGRCEFISADGKRCESQHQLEIDHKVPWSQGGSNDENNLQVCCKTHNSFRAMETHGFWWKAKNENHPS